MRKLEVEPLDKARWDRVERGLRERLEQEPIGEPMSERRAAPERRRSRPVLAFVLAGAAAAAIGAVAWEKVARAPAVVEHPSEVARIETRDAPSHLEFGGATLEFAAHSSARIEGTYATGVLLTLDHGGVECEVAPRHDRPPFVVRAGDVDVRVVGTHFRVERVDSATHVSVQRGVVEVDSHGTTSRVPAGSTWPPTAENPTPEPTVTAQAPSPVRRVATSAAQEPHETPAAPIASTEPAPSPRARYDRALTLEATRPDEAFAIYRDLATGNDSWAANALYAEARLELERGNKDNARRLFAQYLSRYPSGPNANDARELSAKLQ
jgi:hypothetical protein